jgi:hypothetical protein
MKVFEIVETVLNDMYKWIKIENEREKDLQIKVAKGVFRQYFKELHKTNRIDYSDPVYRFIYLLTYVTCHADLVCQAISSCKELQSLFDAKRVQITSIGGGPGSELLGILKYLERHEKNTFLKFNLYDKQTGWNECWDDIEDKLEEELRMTVHPEAFDITDQESWQGKHKFLESDLFTMVFFMSEVFSVKEKAEPFFLNLFENAKPGAMFLFIDNSTAMFYEWFDEMISRYPIDVIKRGVNHDARVDINEDKQALKVYWEKFGHPRLTADMSYRICRKRS